MLWCGLVLLSFSSIAQEASFSHTNSYTAESEKKFFRLGTQVLSLCKWSGEFESPFILLSLHDNEDGIESSARQYVAQYGGDYVWLDNNNAHNINFEFRNKHYSVNPWKIFTKKGRLEEVKSGPYSSTLVVEVERLANFIMEELRPNKAVVALRHGKGADKTINWFTSKKRKNLVADYHKSATQDEHDFIITADKDVFESLKAKDFNVVLREKVVVKDEGSLSSVYQKLRRSFIEVITMEGHSEQQDQMVAALKEALNSSEPDVAVN